MEDEIALPATSLRVEYMNFLHVFLNSIRLPNKKALFRLNRIGMDTAVIYIFILLAIVSLPALVERLTDTSGLGSDISVLFKLIYFFMFYYLPLNLIIFTALSVLAYLGRGISLLMKRKLRFQILWKMGAFASTIPLLLYAAISFFHTLGSLYLIMASGYTVFLLILMIAIYPKKRPAK